MQGDYFGGTVKTKGSNSDFNGQNILGRWRRTLSEQSDLALQVYFDRYYKEDGPGRTSDEMNTADVDFQYRFRLAKKHRIVTGFGYRMVRDHFISNTPTVAILPARKNLDLINAFVQDEIALSTKLKLTAGTKIIHNVYTGVEFQPGIRSALSVGNTGTLWAAVTRAVRTPSRLDVDYFTPAAPQPPTAPSVAGGPNFQSEKLNAFELGYRLQPNGKSTISIAGFYNKYKDVYSVETVPGTLTYLIQNGAEGKSWGAEISGTYQISDKWRIRAGYTFFDKELKAKPGHIFDPSYLSNDVKHQAILHSMVDLPFGLHLDVVGRYLDSLPKTLATNAVPSYFTFDTRLAYTFKLAELSLVGQNLFEEKHTEFGSLTLPRHYYAKLSFRF